jgi:hypothetical protein
MNTKLTKDDLLVSVLVVSALLAVVSIVSFLTSGSGSMVVVSLGMILPLMFGVLVWLSLGFVGILRAVAVAFTGSGFFCMFFKPVAGISFLLIGIAIHSLALWIRRRGKHDEPPKV